MEKIKYFAVTGTFHGMLIDAFSEGDARRAFHDQYNGESIIHLIQRALPSFMS
jgi:hypothetical protein